MTGPCGVLQSDQTAAWLEAIGTVGAFAVALILAWFALRDRRESQARLVAAFSSGGAISYPQPGMTTSTGSDQCQFDPGVLAAGPSGIPLGLGTGTATFATPTTEFQWTLVNRSQEMISHVRPALVNEKGEVLYTMNEIPVVWPGWDRTERIFTPTSSHNIGGQLHVRVIFRDAVGREWSRISGHKLERRGRRRG